MPQPRTHTYTIDMCRELMGSDNFWDTVAGHQLSIEARSFENNPRALQVVKQQLAAK